MISIENVETVGWDAAIRGMRNPMNSWDKSDSYIDSIPLYPDEGSIEIEYPGMNHDYAFCIGKNDQKLMRQLSKAGTADHRKFMRMIVVYMDITAPLYWWKEFDTYKVGTVANSCSTMHKIHAKEFTLEEYSIEKTVGEEKFYSSEFNVGDFSCEHLLHPYGIGNCLSYTVDILNYYRDIYINGGTLPFEDENGDITEVEYEPKDKTIWWQLIQFLPSSYNQKRTVMLNYEVLRNMYTSRKNHKLDEWRNMCEFMKTLPMSDLITGDTNKEV